MWPNPQETADLVTFTEEIVDGKLHFLCSASHELALFHDICPANIYLFKANNSLFAG